MAKKHDDNDEGGGWLEVIGDFLMAIFFCWLE